MTDQQILLEQILSKVVETAVLGPQPPRGCDPAHARHLVHIHQRPAAREPRAPPPLQEHHPRHHAHVVLPAVAQLVPPFSLDDRGGGDLVDGPEVAVVGVEEDGLEDVLVVRLGGHGGVVVLPELVLVVCAVEGHFDLLHVRRVRVRVVHGAVAAGLAVLPLSFVFGKGDLRFLRCVLRWGAEGGLEGGFVVAGEVLAVAVGDGDVVVEVGAAQDEALAPGGCFAEEFLGVIGQDAEDHFVVGGSRAGGACVPAFALAGISLAGFGVEGGGFKDDTLRRAGFDRGDVGVGVDFDAFGFEVAAPVAVEGF